MILEMLEGEVKQGDKLLFRHGNGELAKVQVIGVVNIHGDKVIVVSINNEPPVHIDEELLRERCVWDLNGELS